MSVTVDRTVNFRKSQPLKFANELIDTDFNEASLWDWFGLCFGGVELINPVAYNELFDVMQQEAMRLANITPPAENEDPADDHHIDDICKVLSSGQQMNVWRAVLGRYRNISLD